MSQMLCTLPVQNRECIYIDGRLVYTAFVCCSFNLDCSPPEQDANE